MIDSLTPPIHLMTKKIFFFDKRPKKKNLNMHESKHKLGRGPKMLNVQP